MSKKLHKEKHMSWDTYFMSLAVLSSFRSKDPKTQNGACIVDTQQRVLAMGYNGLPKGLRDSEELFWSDEDSDPLRSKHSYVVHAEANAIYNKNLADIRNSTLYVTCFPCRECAKAIIQNGISRVVFLWKKEHHEKINEVVELMFESANVEYVPFKKLESEDEEYLEVLKESGNKFYS
jgi:dCMP deaminase